MAVTINGALPTPDQQLDFAASMGLARTEAGTFVPTITGTTTPGVGTYSTQSGFYSRVGDCVTVFIQITWSAHTGTGNMRIEGLPFPTKSGVGALFQIQGSNMTWAGALEGRAFAASTQIRVQSSASAQTNPSDIAIDAAASIVVSGTYICA